MIVCCCINIHLAFLYSLHSILSWNPFPSSSSVLPTDLLKILSPTQRIDYSQEEKRRLLRGRILIPEWRIRAKQTLLGRDGKQEKYRKSEWVNKYMHFMKWGIKKVGTVSKYWLNGSSSSSSFFLIAWFTCVCSMRHDRTFARHKNPSWNFSSFTVFFVSSTVMPVNPRRES